MWLGWGDFPNLLVEDSKKTGIEHILQTSFGQMILNLDGEVVRSSFDKCTYCLNSFLIQIKQFFVFNTYLLIRSRGFRRDDDYLETCEGQRWKASQLHNL